MAVVETPERDPYECPLTYDAYPDPSYCAIPPYPLARFLGNDEGAFSTYNNNQIDALPAFPNAAFDQGGYTDFWCAHYLPQDQSHSPGRSMYSSSHLSSDWSDPDSTPYSSPEPVNAYTPYIARECSLPEGIGPYQGFQTKGDLGCVALHDVQQYADTEQEKVTFDDEILIYGACAHDGYQPATTADSNSACYVPCLPSQYESEATRLGSNPEAQIAPALRKRQRRSGHTTHTHHSSAKSFDRPSQGRKALAPRGKLSLSSGTTFATRNARSFPCPLAVYGCTSTFGSKNEWKRHVSTQHIRLNFWRCDQCPTEDRQPNDFNRKDLFIQHVRRMHPIILNEHTSAASVPKKGRRGSDGDTVKDAAMETALAEIAKRCTIKLRDAPMQSGCLFCDASFEGPSSWEERMEHVGRHMEAARKLDQAPPQPDFWRQDDLTERWLRAEGLVVKGKGGRLVLTDLK
ncbi:hypothetical protein D0862_06007 [Hortaea werneckii]|uniref:C2H2-type domain-containing protein n=1 Tax=Hortaea werneckii TaxID=91943 RepID=A0A3M7GMP3_HORWE|nr:hypothetical protein KC320_g3645 [Hortaea werneckii]RMZ02491.1 hypothetical protein D0862_06007 [Hortaea werneckii]